MKPLRVAEGIVPLGEFKARASSIIKGLRKKSGPLVITQNGRPAAVVMAPEAYDELQERERFLEAVALGLSDATAGRVVDHAKVAEWLATWGTDQEGDPPL
jgi:prevent-host-death family protein